MSRGKKIAGTATVQAKGHGVMEAEVALAEVATSRKTGETMTITLPGGAKMKMVLCPPGAFTMGSPKHEEGRDNEETQHRVTLTEGIWMAKTEVTQKQWKSVMGNNPSRFKGDDLPVENVSWYDCQEFCRKARLALPTEAQWEYACLVGNGGAFGGTGRPEDMGWYQGNSRRKAHPVGQKQPNAWGLYDMHGNVWEWCADWCERDLGTQAVTNPRGPVSGAQRVCHGGSWLPIAYYFRSACRANIHPSCTGLAGGDVGFHPIRVLP